MWLQGFYSWPSMLCGMKKSTSAAKWEVWISAEIQKQIYSHPSLSMSFLSVHNYIVKCVCKQTRGAHNLGNATAAPRLQSNCADQPWQLEITFSLLFEGGKTQNLHWSKCYSRVLYSYTCTELLEQEQSKADWEAPSVCSYSNIISSIISFSAAFL